MTTSAPRRPSVLHLAHDLGGGGLERVTVNLCNRLARAGYPVHLGTWGRAEGDFYDPLVDDRVRRVRFARRARRGGRLLPGRIVRRVLGVSDLARYLRRHGVAIVHAHNESTLRLAVAARRLAPGTSVVWHHHDGEHRLAPDRSIRWAAPRADRVIVVTDDLVGWAKEWLGIDPARVTVLPNFVEPDFLEPEGVAGDLPGAAGKRIVCVANLRRSKDHASVVRAMVDVVVAVPDAHLLLVGGRAEAEVEVALRADIDRLGLGTHVTLLGRRRDVAGILRASTVGVLGSSYEGAPLAVLEYGLAGLPVVATAVGECPRMLDGGRAGTLVPPGDAAALGAALVCYLGAPALRAAHGGALRDRVRTRYSPEATLSVLEGLYDGLAGTS